MLKNKNFGITLVALIITIIILLILAGVTIATLSGENGLLARAKTAKIQQNREQTREELILEISTLQINKMNDENRDIIIEDLQEITDISEFVKNENSGATFKYKGYTFEISKNFIITKIDGEGFTTTGETSTGGTQSGTGSNESALINSFSIKEEDVGGTNIKINIDGEISTTDGSNIIGYIIFINNEAKKVTDTMPYNITSLDIGTTYTIDVMAIDKNGNTKKTNSKLNITTLQFLVETLNYPIVTSNGVVNQKCTNPADTSDYYYTYNPDVDCTAIDALDKAAYDGDESTYYDPSSTKNKFYFGSDCDIYNACFKIDSSYKGVIFYYITGSGSIAVHEGTILSNGYFHTTYYGKGTDNWKNSLSKLNTKVYEIKYDNSL